VVKYNSIRTLLAIVAHFNLELEQLDVKTAFLHGELEERIYIKQPEILLCLEMATIGVSMIVVYITRSW